MDRHVAGQPATADALERLAFDCAKPQELNGMSTIVVVRKGSLACMACDTLASIGSIKQKAHYCAATGKIFGFRDAWIGTVGYAVHNTVLQSYFSHHAQQVNFATPADIFETWRQMHKTLRED